MVPNEDNLTHTHCLNAALIAGVFAPWLKNCILLNNDLEAEVIKINDTHISRPVVNTTDNRQFDLRVIDTMKIKCIR